MAEPGNAPKAAKAARRKLRKHKRSKQQKKLSPKQPQGHYADPMSPIASTPMKRQRAGSYSNNNGLDADSKSSSSKKTPSSAQQSNRVDANGGEKLLSPRKLLAEFDSDEPKTKKMRASLEPLETKQNVTQDTAAAAADASTGEDTNDELFSPALKPPKASRSSSVSPCNTRARLESKFAGVTSPSVEEELKVAVVEETTSPAPEAEGADEEADTEQEFNPFYFMKTLPKYEDIVLDKRPISLPERSRNTPNICLVLDLDETLVHCSVDEVENPHLQFPVTFNGVEYTVNVKKRPHMEYFLKRVSRLFEIVVFTASHKVYAEKLMNMLDPNRNLIKHRLYREDCLDVFGNYLKDLNVLGRDLSKVLLVDNSPHAFGYQVSNGIPIETWYDDESDAELLNLLPFLESLVDVDDVRPVVEKQFQIQKLIDATPDEIV